MQSLGVSVLILSALAWQAPVSAGTDSIGTRIADFQLPDHLGELRRLTEWRDSRLVVVAFLGVDCPLAKLYAGRLAELYREYRSKGVAFVGIDSNQHESPADVTRFVRDHQFPFPILKDGGSEIADRFAALRTPEVFILDEHQVVRYRGRIDDQYTVGGRRAEPSRHDLRIALDELLAGAPVSQPVTPAAGCLIGRQSQPSAASPVTYSRDIAPILQAHCVTCHRRGQIAPFALTTYRQAAARAETIREVIRDGRMPPWHANPKHGRFANDPRLSDRDKQLLEDWLRAGLSEGDPADLPPAARFRDGWNIPEPDQVVSIPRPFTVPAEGVVEYQTFEVDPGFREPRWVRAAEIRPGNRKVVHHCIVFLKPPGGDEPAEQGTLGSFCLAATTPGTPPLFLPDGMAKLVPAGWRFFFVLHYAPIGTVQTDQTSIGLVFADPKTVKKEVATKLIHVEDLCIPPRAANHRVERSHSFSGDVLLLAMLPHMHLRGKSFRYEAAYPDGTTEILLDVPRYDFNWQNRYVLAEPKRLPAGTSLRCSAHYDNSAGNPFNPDPDAVVRTGLQSWDEMFNGYFEFALADQDLTRPPEWAAVVRDSLRAILRPLLGFVVVPAGATWLLLKRWRRKQVQKASPSPAGSGRNEPDPHVDV
jgi:peroxiredoxin